MNNHKKWVSETFDRTASEYGKKSSSCFDYFGKRLARAVDVLPGQHVLDIATGRGAVLFPLAHAVGPLGKVVGIDISQQMIAETSREAIERGMHWVKLHCMDAEHLDFSESCFDYVFCGFGLFFLPSIPIALSEFKRVLKPQGKLVVSTWGEDSKLDLLINEEIKKLSVTNSLIATPLWSDKELAKLLEEACFKDIQIFEETLTFSHETAEEWWNSLWSHATRAKLEQISSEQLIKLREKVISLANGLLTEDLQVFYGIATKRYPFQGF
jgi:ubiquinone/menaquinone biosynthesis C-methylase UbiE